MTKLKKFEKLLKQNNTFLLFDLEANTERNSQLKDMKIIQIGYLIFNTKFKILDKWSIFIKQEANAPKLSSFIKKLTWITETELNNWVYFKDWLKQFLKLYDKCDYLLSYGNYDMKQIYSDCNNLEIKYPFEEWNLWNYSKHFNIKDIIAKKLDIKSKWMESLIKYLWLKLEWKHHNWEDDCQNIFNIIKKVFFDKPQKYLFLDIDWVLNTFSSNNDLDEDLAENLEMLIYIMDLKIIITSDRRYDLEDFTKIWLNNWLPIFYDITKTDKKNLISDSKKLAKIRTKEILEYIKKNNIKDYIIFDDLELDIKNNFYKINPYKWFDSELLKKVIYENMKVCEYDYKTNTTICYDKWKITYS